MPASREFESRDPGLLNRVFYGLWRCPPAVYLPVYSSIYLDDQVPGYLGTWGFAPAQCNNADSSIAQIHTSGSSI